MIPSQGKSVQKQSKLEPIRQEYLKLSKKTFRYYFSRENLHGQSHALNQWLNHLEASLQKNLLIRMDPLWMRGMVLPILTCLFRCMECLQTCCLR